MLDVVKLYHHLQGSIFRPPLIPCFCWWLPPWFFRRLFFAKSCDLGRRFDGKMVIVGGVDFFLIYGVNNLKTELVIAIVLYNFGS